MTHIPKTLKPLRGRNRLTRFPGICEQARKLGVDRRHLYWVCTGARDSKRIEATAWFKQVGGKKRRKA